MSIDRSFERIIADALVDEAPRRGPSGLAESVLALTRGQKPRPRWLTVIKESPMHLDSRPAFGSPVARTAGVLFLTLIVALLAVGTVVAGASLLPSPSALIPPDRGVFTSTESMAAGRVGATATRLIDGRVLVIGGFSGGGSAEIWDSETRLFSPAGDLSRNRDFHTTTLLSDGRVLVVDGRSAGEVRLHAAADIWEPETMSFTSISPPSMPRYGGRAMLLPDGRVLVVGSFDDDAFGPEVWDPKTDTWSPADSLPEASYPAGTFLSDGRILVISEVDGAASLWDPSNKTSTPAGRLAEPRGGFTATRLADGRVLVTGGSLIGPAQCQDGVTPRPHGSCAGGSVNGANFLASAEIWDPRSMSFSSTGSLTQPHFQHAATLLDDGRVLVVGNHWGSGTDAELFELK
jgi:hypothetical protein